jgi:hypothetical protein
VESLAVAVGETGELLPQALTRGLIHPEDVRPVERSPATGRAAAGAGLGRRLRGPGHGGQGEKRRRQAQKGTKPVLHVSLFLLRAGPTRPSGGIGARALSRDTSSRTSGRTSSTGHRQDLGVTRAKALVLKRQRPRRGRRVALLTPTASPPARS